jgi:hypothetical protein
MASAEFAEKKWDRIPFPGMFLYFAIARPQQLKSYVMMAKGSGCVRSE